MIVPSLRQHVRKPAKRFVIASAVSALLCVFHSGCKPQSDVVNNETSTDASAQATPSMPAPAIVPELPRPIEVDSVLDRVLVVENVSSPTSIQIARYYMEKRGVKKVFQIRCADSARDPEAETLEYVAYQAAVEKPLREYLAKDAKIDFIVLTKGIPLRLANAPVGFSTGRPSLDSCLAALDYFQRSDSIRTVIVENDLKGTAFVNRFWNSKERFSHAKHGGYLVTRLDGYTAASAMALVDSALAGEKSKPTGSVLLDSMALPDPVDISKVPVTPFRDGMKDMETITEIGWGEWNVDLYACNSILNKAGVPSELERTEKFVDGKQPLMGYASWGSNDGKYVAANYLSMRFAPGAIAETAVSTSARTFLPTTGGQSLIADLIESRVTGVKGYCDEPFLLAVASPSVLFDRYTRGWTLAESFYAASRFVGWEDIVIGDPLSAPYAASHN